MKLAMAFVVLITSLSVSANELDKKALDFIPKLECRIKALEKGVELSELLILDLIDETDLWISMANGTVERAAWILELRREAQLSLLSRDKNISNKMDRMSNKCGFSKKVINDLNNMPPDGITPAVLTKLTNTMSDYTSAMKEWNTALSKREQVWEMTIARMRSLRYIGR